MIEFHDEQINYRYIIQLNTVASLSVIFRRKANEIGPGLAGSRSTQTTDERAKGQSIYTEHNQKNVENSKHSNGEKLQYKYHKHHNMTRAHYSFNIRADNTSNLMTTKGILCHRKHEYSNAAAHNDILVCVCV